jgi:hypothetical protein
VSIKHYNQADEYTVRIMAVPLRARARFTEPDAEENRPTLGVFCDYTEAQNVVNINQPKTRLEDEAKG